MQTCKESRFFVAVNGKYQAAGSDIHSIVADPGFVNPRKHDFHFAGLNTANKIGFKPFDINHFGPEMPYFDNPIPDAFPTTPAKYSK
jgi:hypothetical protein